MNYLTFGQHEAQTLEQMDLVTRDPKVYKGVLCADGHLGYSVPIGGVLAYEKAINVNGVGFDIACGNKAVRLELNSSLIKSNLPALMDIIYKEISFGVGRKNNEQVEHSVLEDSLFKEISFLKELKDKARAQLGTVGSGNHYVDIFEDEKGRIWIGVHFGSRGLGHSIATHFLKQGGGKDSMMAPSIVFNETSDLGEQYLKCMDLAGRYAYAGRDWVCEKVAKILKGNIVEEVHNHHNFAWKEEHDGKTLWVVRKGATPSFPGQRGFVGGSMGDISVILEGKDSSLSKKALYSTVHGAGRVMGRNQAKGKVDRKGRVIKPGRVSREEMKRWLEKEKVVLRGADLDEAPQCYRRLPDVLNVHKETIQILHTLKPLGVAMAGHDEFDPYKD